MKKIFFLTTLILVFVSASPAQTLSKMEDELLGHFQKLSKSSNYNGASDYDVLGKENQAIRTALLRYGLRADVLKFAFTRLRKQLTLTTSRDGNLRTYSWESEEGGTMHDFYTVYQFRSRSGKVHTWAEPYSQDREKRGAGGFVRQIFQTDTGSGPIYLTVTIFIGSTSIGGQTISALKIEGEGLDRNPKVIKTSSGFKSSISFQYDFFSVVDHPERPVKLFYFDDSKKSFRFPIVIQDKKTPQGRVTNRFITYRFNGKYFEKVS